MQPSQALGWAANEPWAPVPNRRVAEAAGVTATEWAPTASPAAPDASSTVGTGGSLERLPPDSAVAQAALFAHQHPADCGSAQFLRLGSVIGIVASALVTALATNRVLLVDAACGRHLTRGHPCGTARASITGDSASGDGCFFLPLSNCSLRLHATKVTTRTHPLPSKHVDGRNWPVRIVERVLGALGSRSRFRRAGDRVTAASLMFGAPRRGVPAGLVFAEHQAVHYIMRLRPGLADAIRAAAGRATIAMAVPPLMRGPRDAAAAAKRNESAAAAAAGFTLVRLPLSRMGGIVSVYVRHGDKGSEMRLTTLGQHMGKAAGLVPAEPPRSRAIFLSTDDPRVVAEAAATLPAAGWTVYWDSTAPRLRHNPLGRRPEAAAELAAADLTVVDVFTQQLAELDRVAAAGAFVHTLGSNLCRVANALRCVRCGEGRRGPFVDLKWSLRGKGKGRWALSATEVRCP